MLNSLSKDSSLYKYLDRECRWLLEPLKEGFYQSINIRFSPTTRATPEGWLRPSVSTNYIFSDKTDGYARNLKNINTKETNNHPRNLAGMSGCYLFTNIVTNQQYIGSSIDLYNRFKSHKINSIRPHRGGNTPLYKSVKLYTWANFSWTPIYISTNHITAFLKTKNKESLNANYLKLLNQEMLSDQEIYILRSFTQFEARIYEQSIITIIKPVLNSTLVVTGYARPFLNWREGETGLTNKLNNDVYLIAVDKANSITINFNSINAAVIGLGIPITTLKRYMNYINMSVYSPVLDKEIFIVNNKLPLLEGWLRPPEFNNKTNFETIKEWLARDLYNLEFGKLFAYLMDKQTIFGTFKSPNEAAFLLDGKKDSKYISRYINLERPVIVGHERTPVYFVMHPDWKNNKSGRISYRWVESKSSLSKSIILEDTLENTTTLYESVSDLLTDLGLNKSFTSVVKRYMNPTKLYKNRYKFFYATEWLRPKGNITKYYSKDKE
jgi:hypothetical protein